MKCPCRFAAVTATLVISCVCLPPPAAAGESSAPQQRACLDMDVVITTRIEDHGAAQAVPAADLAKAAMQQMEARALCGAGLVTEALNAYARIRFPQRAESLPREQHRTN